MRKELFEQYAELKKKQKEIESSLSLLQPEIVKDLQEAGADKAESDLGTFSLSNKKTWTFSSAVTALEEQVEQKKAEERADGTATVQEKQFLLFRAK